MAFIKSPIVIIIAGVILCVGVAFGMYFVLIQPLQNQLGVQQKIYDSNAQYMGPGPLNAANQKVTDARAQVARVQAQWDTIQRTRNPVIDISNIFHAWQQLTTELVFTLGPDLEHQLHDAGVTPEPATVSLGGPPSDPNAVASYATYIPISVGAERVTGTFPQILKHVADWNHFNRIALVSGLTLAGNSPNLTGSYNLMIYEFTLNGSKPGKPVNSGSGGGGGGASGGGGGGGGGGGNSPSA